MRRIFTLIVLVYLILLTSGIANLAFGASQVAEYLCEFGIVFYRQGRYDDALAEFKKVLLLEPENETAKEYMNSIFQQETPTVVAKAKSTPPTITSKKIVPQETVKQRLVEQEKKVFSRQEAIENAFRGLQKEQKLEEGFREKEARYKVAGIKISGESQIRLGVDTRDTIWKRANWDLNEKNWRIMSGAAFDRHENTFDPRVYDRLRVNLDTDNESGLGFHSNITVDPWSFTGKSSKFTITGTGGDSAELELKYWSNTGYTINESIDTLKNGDSFTLPEIKVTGGETSGPVTRTSAYNNTFTIPQVKIYRDFQPVRELWFDYKEDNLKLRVYPIAYENQALTFDDPLKLSNNRIWWEDSPWLRSWKHGNFNSGASPVDFTKGYWDNTLSFFTKDSEGQRLTSLRGFSFEFNPQEETSLVTSIATPKHLWQEYSNVDNFISATRLKHSITEDLNLGLTATTRFGYNLDNHNKLDARNLVLGTDMGYEIVDGIMANFEVAYSRSKYDITDPIYQTESRGNAYYFSLLGRFPRQSIMDTEHGYDGIQPEKEENSFTKFRFFVSRMDENFDEPLSSYVETRDDESWSRHIHFRKPFKYYYQGENQLLSWDDIKNYAIGNGIDNGRSVIGFRLESLLCDKKIDNLFDVRNVHDSDHKFVENVAREELSWDINDKLTTKLLGIYHRLPKTKAGFDPFVFDPRTGRYFTNTSIEDGKDPSVTTGSLGLEYEFFDWLALNGIWEYTNDISLAYDNFPRGTFNTASRSFISFSEEDNRYRDILASLYNQGFFPTPYYLFYNIFKTGLRFNPMEDLDIYLDYTCNPYKKAGQVDDNMNHVGLEVSYSPTPKWGLFFKYTYSRWQDLDKLQQGITEAFGHYNLFTELVFRKSADEDITFQYGEASRNPYMGGVLDIGWDPYGGSLRTIDTQHILRLYYRRRF